MRLLNRLAWGIAAVALVAVAASLATASMPEEPQPRGRFEQPVAGLSDADTLRFLLGRVEFLQSWSAPPRGGPVSGLGPLFNRNACIACHPAHGRGETPLAPDARLRSALLRLSVPGPAPHGAPRPHPHYGTQLQDEAVAGVPREGQVTLQWTRHTVWLADGQRRELIRPQPRVGELGYGPMGSVMTSLRVGQPVFGLGLLEAIPETTLQQMAAEQAALGLRGRTNRVWDVAHQRLAVGRFGWKANSPSIRQQVAEALAGDMGITTRLLPTGPCMPRQAACARENARHTAPEMPDKRLDDLEFHLAHVAPPAPAATASTEAGRRLFSALGCAACHRPAIAVPAHTKFGQTLGPQTIHAYTDLLLHDMGPSLADGRPDHRATGREWRTTPLWGIGQTRTENGHTRFLHDGRARNLEEAILWHGGEAQPAQNAYRRLSAELREALLAFLNTL